MNEQDLLRKKCVEVLNEMDANHNILAERFKPMSDGTLWYSMHDHIDEFIEKLSQRGVSFSSCEVLENA